MRLSSCISLDLLYIQNGDEPSEKLFRFVLSELLAYKAHEST